MSTFLTRPTLTIGEVRIAFGSAFARLTKDATEEDDLCSPNEVFQAVAGAMQTMLVNMTDDNFAEISVRQPD